MRCANLRLTMRHIYHFFCEWQTNDYQTPNVQIPHDLFYNTYWLDYYLWFYFLLCEKVKNIIGYISIWDMHNIIQCIIHCVCIFYSIENYKNTWVSVFSVLEKTWVHSVLFMVILKLNFHQTVRVYSNFNWSNLHK